jgi:hypothetical protein
MALDALSILPPSPLGEVMRVFKVEKNCWGEVEATVGFDASRITNSFINKL